MARLTKRAIDSAVPDEIRNTYLWDGDLPGFGVRIQVSGRKTFILQYRNAQRRARWITIGKYGPMTLNAARKKALALLADIQKGEDPSDERRQSRKDPAIRDLAERFMREYAEPQKKPRSVAENKRLLDKFILPTLGRVKVSAISRNDIAKLHHAMRETPTQANQTRALLSTMLNFAERWGLRPDGSNPCKHIQKFKEQKRERYLSVDELERLGQVLTRAEEESSEWPSVITALRLLVLSGARKNEILTLCWEHVDLENGLLRLPDSKTGAKIIPLGEAALEVLENASHVPGNPYVCFGRKHGGHLIGLQKAWMRIRARAGLDDVRVHDLRHSFASVGVSGGMGLPMVGALLGHRKSATTERYAHLAADPLKEAANEITTKIASAMRGEAGSKVVKLKKAT